MFYVKKSERDNKTTCFIYKYHMRKYFAAITARFIFIPSQ